MLKVKVGLSAKEVQPGSAVQLQFQAAPGSLCAVQAVNEKMFFVRPESELTSQMVSICARRQKNPAVIDEPQEAGSACGEGSQKLMDEEVFVWRRKQGLPGEMGRNRFVC